MSGLLLSLMVMFAVAIPIRADAQTGCTSGACVSAGPRLVAVDTTQSVLLNTLFQAILPGTSVQLNAVDWNALATSNINLNALVTRLGTNLSLSDPSQVLAANITLAQLQAAMVQVLQADGNTAAVNALNLLSPTISGIAGTIRLGDLLQIALPQGSLANINLDVLDLLTGSAQLYNFKNVLTTPTPITLDTAALGLTGVANVQLWLQIVEPPIYTCGPAGTQFYSSAVRVKLNLDVLQGIDVNAIVHARQFQQRDSISGGRTDQFMDWSSKLEYRRDSGAEQRTQWVTTNRLAYRLNEDWRLAAWANYADTRDDLNPAAGARLAEVNFGFAWRPHDSTKWAAFGKYTYLYDSASQGQLDINQYDQRSHVVSLEGIRQLDDRWQVAGKVASRWGDYRMGRGTGPWLDSRADFLSIQFRYHLIARWEGLAENRMLKVREGGILRGWLVGLDRQVSENFKIGIGYNFTNFSGDLTQLDFRYRGWFLNMTGHY